jgi:hypothetical protein
MSDGIIFISRETAYTTLKDKRYIPPFLDMPPGGKST